jgi:hypothetical protein
MIPALDLRQRAQWWQGTNFDHGVLVIGQAVCGWIPGWMPADVKTLEGGATIIEETRRVFADLRDPMGWTGGHRVENTPFWRTAHEVVDAMTPVAAPGTAGWRGPTCTRSHRMTTKAIRKEP